MIYKLKISILKPLIFCIVLLGNSVNIKAQTEEDPVNKKWDLGFLYGQADQSLINVNYLYQTKLYSCPIYYTFSVKPKYVFEIIAQPQYNTTSYIPSLNSIGVENGYEFGLNLGIIYRRFNPHKNFHFYFGASLGPHYISGSVERQVAGFIFSDNIFVGIHLKIFDKIYLDFRPGFRHLSNASFKRPNGGINSITANIGIRYDF